MSTIPPPQLNSNNYDANGWLKYKQAFEIYLAAIGMNIEDKETGKRICSLLLHCMGQEGIAIYNTFGIAKKDVNNYSVLLDKFDSYFLPKRNTTFERHKFFIRSQKDGESIENYVTELKILAATCEFENLKDSLIRDRVVCGIQNDTLREKLLGQPSLTLDKCIEMCKSTEAVRTQMEKIAHEDNMSTINKIQIQPKGKAKEETINKFKNQSGEHKKIFKCSRCGRDHKIN